MYTFISAIWPHDGVSYRKKLLNINETGVYISGISENAFEFCVANEKADSYISLINSLNISNLHIKTYKFDEPKVRTPWTFPVQVI